MPRIRGQGLNATAILTDADLYFPPDMMQDAGRGGTFGALSSFYPEVPTQPASCELSDSFRESAFHRRRRRLKKS